jgi:MFS transporter, DHA2 family, multidrug resistance protein
MRAMSNTRATAIAMPPTEIDGPRRTLITISVMFTSVIQTLDNTIANVALPRIQGSLSATQDQMAWVLTSYIVAAAIMTPLSGWLAGQFGRKKVFLYSVAGFTVASMLCGMAHSLGQIVSARLFQGMCGAALVPLSQAVLLDINPPARHARAMSVWVMGVTLGPIIGPALGGWLTENYNWRWVFYVNVPVGILAFLGIMSFLPKAAIRKSRFDFFGFAALSLAVAAFQIMLDRGQLMDWFSSTEICVEATISAVALYLFIIHMLTTTQPSFVSPALFKDRNFLTGNVFIFIIGVILFATLALLPPLLQDLLNYPVVTTGLVTAPRGFGTLLAMIVVGRITGKVDIRLIIGAGFVLTALSSWQMTGFDLQMDYQGLLWAGVLQGAGVGFVYVPLATAAFATLSPALRNEGTAIFSLTRNIGSSIGISAVNTLLTRNTQIMHASLGEHVSRYNPLLRAQSPSGIPTLRALANLNAAVTEQAAMIAYNNDFKLMMLMSMAALPLVLLLRKGGGQSGVKTETVHIE